MSNISLIVLAAGASTRMGKPKQLLPYQGRSLLRYTVEQAIASKAQPIVVVLGAYAELIQPNIKDLPIDVVENPSWSQGMSTSIHVGMSALDMTSVDAVIITLCDQPFVSAQIFDRLIETYHSIHSAIVASKYQQTCGVPALFDRALFPHLLELKGQAGAKRIIDQYPNHLHAVPFEPGAIDIDTPDDYENLKQME
jgi:molybdenum cofactor cytidylyltransferase